MNWPLLLAVGTIGGFLYGFYLGARWALRRRPG